MSGTATRHQRITSIVFIAILLGFASVCVSCASVEEGGAGGDLPASFDLRDVDGHCYVTPVKLQNPFGICWGFAAISAAETSVLGSHLADDPKAYETLDVSEKQLAYFSHTFIDDPSSTQNGEGSQSYKYQMKKGKPTLTEPLVSGDFYNTGGSPFLATNSFAAGIGPTLESADESLVYRGKAGKSEPSKDGTVSRFCYAEDDDWTIDERLRFMQDYVLKEAYFLPSPANFEESASPEEGNGSEEGAYEYQYDEEATEAIKRQLMQISGVTITYRADTARPGQDGSKLYISDNWAHYTYDAVIANHGVTIVGWDDNYPAEHFHHEVYKLKDPDAGYIEDNYLVDENGDFVVDEETTALTTPPANGAWLCKNSWGSGEREFPNRGTGAWGIPVQKTDADGKAALDESGQPVMVGSGYFWLSYYDQSLDSPEAFVFDTETIARGGFNDHNTLHCNQYDLMPVMVMGANESDELIKSANVFTAEKGEILLAASYITNTPNTTVTVEVYLLNDDFDTPEDGLLVASNTQTRELAGFYIDYLGDTTVDIQPNQSYSVIVTQKQASGKYVIDYPSSMGKYSALAELTDTKSYSVAVQHDESHVYSNGTWGSWADEAVRDELLKLNEETGLEDGTTKKMTEQLSDTVYDNFPIKVYAFYPQDDVFVRLADGADRLSVRVGERGTVARLELYGPKSEDKNLAEYANDEIISNEWVVESGSESLVEVVPSADGTSAQIKGLAPGTAHVVAHIQGLGRVIIPVDVRERE